MSWTDLTSEEKLIQWRDFRLSLKELDLQNQCKLVSEFFATFPFGKNELNSKVPTSWPTPWEMILSNNYSVNTISLLIYYTLRLTDDNINVKIAEITDQLTVTLYPIINDTHILNYNLGKLVSLSAINTTCIKIITDIKQYS